MKIQVFGDSMSWGADGAYSRTDYTHGHWELAPSVGYIARVLKPWPQYLSPLGTVQNLAIPGENSARCLAGLSSPGSTTDGHFPVVTIPGTAPFASLLDADADIVILAHSILDQVLASIASYKANLRTMAEAALANDSLVAFWTGTKWYDTPSRQADFAQAARDVAAEYDACVIDAYARTSGIDLSTAAPIDGLHYTQAIYKDLGQYALERLRVQLREFKVVGTLTGEVDYPWTQDGLFQPDLVRNYRPVTVPDMSNGAKYRIDATEDAELLATLVGKIV